MQLRRVLRRVRPPAVKGNFARRKGGFSCCSRSSIPPSPLQRLEIEKEEAQLLREIEAAELARQQLTARSFLETSGNQSVEKTPDGKSSEAKQEEMEENKAPTSEKDTSRPKESESLEIDEVYAARQRALAFRRLEAQICPEWLQYTERNRGRTLPNPYHYH